MKTLYIVRHAKSNWDERSVSDHDRKLNARGLRDAPLMGETLNNKGYHPNIICSSSANRALSTAKIIAEKIGYPTDNIVVTKEIYDATTNDLVNLINTFDDRYESVMLFGHNPGFTVLANLLADKYIDNMPTCAAAVIELNIESWKSTASDCGKLIAFEYPKKYL